MPERRKRKIFEQGHRRKFLVVVDEEPEVETALAYAVRRARRTGGVVAMLFVIEPADFQHWLGVEDAYREESQAKAKAVFRLYVRKLKLWGFEDMQLEEIIREGAKAEEIRQQIDDDPDIGILVLGASVDPSGPGPLVSSLAGGKNAGSFPVPITVVPGCLTLEEIEALA
ncbi:MAG: universal stress protein [Rhodomicrobium sp.]|nr:universal stress protein [Rhodomicrobium sp.]